MIHKINSISFLSIILIFFSLRVSGQSLFSKADYPSVITSSPEASALGKYGDVPVSLFSGTPDISIPIYNFVVGDIKVPIKLSYNAGGIRVDDIATNVGLGWSLNAGGVISQTIHGGPDGTNNMPYPANDFNPNTFDPSAPDYQMGKILVEEHKDFERDIYYYNFLNSSGKFVVNDIGKAAFFPANASIKVNITQNGSVPILITDDRGFKYYFAATESSKTTPVCSVGIPGSGEYQDEVVSAYYLSKIVSPNKYELNFEYEDYSYKVIKSYTEVRYEKQGNLDCAEMTSSNRTCNNVQEIFGKRLRRISSGNVAYSVEFIYAQSKRLDLKFNGVDQGNYLEQINVSSSNSIIKKWDLGYGYFGTGTNLRLKLLSAKSDDQPAYSFFYDEQYPLPERLSFSQDYWGFSNGKSSLNTFIPPIPAIGRVTGADRTPDFNFMKSYSLSSIQYPAGGITNFSYEPHKDYITENNPTYVSEVASLDNVSNGSTDFFLPVDAAELRLVWNLPVSSGDDSMNGYIFGGPNLGTLIKTVSGDGFETIFSNLPTGAQYRLAISASNGNDYGSISLQWKKPVTSNNAGDKIVFGGLRIKSIKSFNDGQLSSSKIYNYNWINNPNRSSIILPASSYDYLVFNSIYMVPKINTASGGAILEGTCGYNVLASSSAQSLGSALDNSIGYAQVTETIEENGTNGRTIYNYLTGGIEGSKGALIEKREQRNQDGLFKNVSALRNLYEQPLNNRDVISNFKINYIQPEVIIGSGDHFSRVPAQFEVQKYLMISGKLNLAETQEIHYNSSATDSLVSKSIYVYANTRHDYPTTVDKVGSDSKTIRTNKRYVLDIVDGSPSSTIYTSMKDVNIIAPVIEERVYNQTDNLLLATRITNYNDFGNSLFQTSSVQSSYENNPLRTDLSFNYFDGHGNLLEQQEINGIKLIYLYSYNSLYPIAEIKNADYATVVSLLGGQGAVDAFAAQPNPDKAAVDAFLAPLKASLPSAFITTFTYKPMVGMTSQTDAKGMTTHYEYDAFGRLQFVKDQDGNIVKSSSYHYKN